MEIRRVDSESVPPPVASEKGALIEFDRRPVGKSPDKQRQHPRNPYAPAPTDDDDQAAPGVYTQEGQLEAPDPTKAPAHRLNVTV
jgi:hypothetical protein